jgi:hypothetical protein
MLQALQLYKHEPKTFLRLSFFPFYKGKKIEQLFSLFLEIMM